MQVILDFYVQTVFLAQLYNCVVFVCVAVTQKAEDDDKWKKGGEKSLFSVFAFIFMLSFFSHWLFKTEV